MTLENEYTQTPPTITIRIRPDLLNRLRLCAAAEDRSLESIIRILALEALKARDGTRPHTMEPTS
jgi:hypothetical protein